MRGNGGLRKDLGRIWTECRLDLQQLGRKAEEVCGVRGRRPSARRRVAVGGRLLEADRSRERLEFRTTNLDGERRQVLRRKGMMKCDLRAEREGGTSSERRG